MCRRLSALSSFYRYAAAAGLEGWRRLSGPLVATASGDRLRQNHLWELVRRLARTAGIDVWDQLSAHSLRHTAITLALDGAANIRDVQDWAGHRPRPRQPRPQPGPHPGQLPRLTVDLQADLGSHHDPGSDGEAAFRAVMRSVSSIVARYHQNNQSRKASS
ncbi:MULTISPECIES: tyrosine-type recombinase/integrase [Prauserella salsuginis group]|uniref:Tyrosine-type recombinase/integrase n=1 Tax=Prauserella salsuginis TaxID=387889 RepID=A0ABW6GBN3_9PSEU